MSVRADHSNEAPNTVPLESLEAFPGTLLVFDGQGQLSYGKPAGSTLVQASLRAPLPALMELIEPALRQGLPRLGTLQAQGNDGIHSYDVTVLPLADGGAVALAHEVTLHNNLRSALLESRQRYKDFVEISSDFAWETGADGTFIFVSPRGALGHSAAALVGRDPGDLVMEREPGTTLPFSTHKPIESQELWLRHTSGSSACVIISAKPVYDRFGRWCGARGVCRDITGERDRDNELIRARNRERILNHVVRTFRDEVDPQGMLRVAAETLARGMGAESCHIYRREKSQDADAIEPNTDAANDGSDDSRSMLIPGAQTGSVPYEDAALILERLQAGEPLVEEEIRGREVLAAPCRYRHEINGAVILWRAPGRGPWGRDDRLLISDIADQIGIANEQIAAHDYIVRISRTDGLTGLFNRRAFFEEVGRRFHRLNYSKESAALMYVDLDNFKKVNDLRGHADGDRALCAVRDLLVFHTRPTDLVARLGGDEFAIWLECGTQVVAESKAAALLELAREKLAPLSAGPDMLLSFSIGIAIYDQEHAETLDELIARADHAMYSVKRRGKAGFSIAPYGIVGDDGELRPFELDHTSPSADPFFPLPFAPEAPHTPETPPAAPHSSAPLSKLPSPP